MVKIFQVIKRSLSNDVKQTFERRIEEGYDLEDDTDRGMLWKIYKGATDVMKNMDVNNNDNDHDALNHSTGSVDSNITGTAGESTSVDSPNIVPLQTSTPSILSFNVVTESLLPVPSTSLTSEPEQLAPTCFS